MNAKKSRDNEARELRDKIVKHTGLSKSKAIEIARDAVRGRDLNRLAIQKGWSIEWGSIVGPSGTYPLSMVMK